MTTTERLAESLKKIIPPTYNPNCHCEFCGKCLTNLARSVELMLLDRAIEELRDYALCDCEPTYICQTHERIDDLTAQRHKLEAPSTEKEKG